MRVRLLFHLHLRQVVAFESHDEIRLAEVPAAPAASGDTVPAAHPRRVSRGGGWDPRWRDARTLEYGNALVYAVHDLEGSRITCVGDCTVEGAGRVIDAAGKTLLPGWLDTHAHRYAGYAAGMIPQHSAEDGVYSGVRRGARGRPRSTWSVRSGSGCCRRRASWASA